MESTQLPQRPPLGPRGQHVQAGRALEVITSIMKTPLSNDVKMRYIWALTVNWVNTTLMEHAVEVSPLQRWFGLYRSGLEDPRCPSRPVGSTHTAGSCTLDLRFQVVRRGSSVCRDPVEFLSRLRASA